MTIVKPMAKYKIRPMEQGDWTEVSELILVSLNYWYAGNMDGPKLDCGPEAMQLHCQATCESKKDEEKSSCGTNCEQLASICTQRRR